MKNNVLAIIPARSGSKGLKDKNIKILNGKPMIAYTIEAAIKSNVFEDIMISTDSEKYSQIAKKYGATIPFLRDKRLATDESTTIEVVEDVLIKLKENGKEYEKFMILQPTSPLRDEIDIKKAFDLLNKKNANSVVSMCECEHSPLWTKQLNESTLDLDGFLSNVGNSGRQKLKKYYRLNGAIYVLKTDYFLKHKNFYKEKSYAYIMDKRKSIDIVDLYDFEYAEFIMNQKVT